MAKDQPEDDGVSIIVTPMQLAAALQQASLLKPHTLANRFWGAMSVIGGAVDLVASVPLWFAPEPTLGTKVAAASLNYVGADVASTGLRQVWTGRRELTLTAKVVRRSLRSLGVDPGVVGQLSRGADTAMNVAALIATPLSVARAANAVRVTSVERGLIDLEVEEGFPGAHTIARHVGKTEVELRGRLAADRDLRAASSFKTLEDAELGVSAVIRTRALEIQEWAAKAFPGQTSRFNLTNAPVKGVVVSHSGTVRESSDIVVVLKKTISEGRVYYILTAYLL